MLLFNSSFPALLLALFVAAGLPAQGDRPPRDDRPSRPGTHADADRPHRQGRGDFARIKAARQDFITERLELTEAEAEAFFPVFWRYDERMRSLMHDDRSARHLRGEDDRAELTEAQARQRIMAHLEKDERIAALKRESAEAYLQLIPAKKLIGLEAANREFRRELLDRIRRKRQ